MNHKSAPCLLVEWSNWRAAQQARFHVYNTKFVQICFEYWNSTIETLDITLFKSYLEQKYKDEL